VNLFILFAIWRKCLRSGSSQSLYIFIRMMKKKDCSNYRVISLLSTTYKISSNILLSRNLPIQHRYLHKEQFSSTK